MKTKRTMDLIRAMVLILNVCEQTLSDVIDSTGNGRDVEVDIDTSSQPFPSNLWMETGDTTITAHWTNPEDISSIALCSLLFKSESLPDNEMMIASVSAGESSHIITGLQRNTLYEIRLFCVSHGSQLFGSNWTEASTRTVSLDVCPGTIPNGKLSADCIRDPNMGSCYVTCKDGYRQVTRRRLVYCHEGRWANYNNNYGDGFRDICLAEAEFEKCSLSIPNGQLADDCGPGTDWVCDLECNEGFHKHSFTINRHNGFESSEMTRGLFCDSGAWKTGFEHFGITASQLCVTDENNCTEQVPNGHVYTPCRSGYSCRLTCDTGFILHPLVRRSLVCENGEWVTEATKYDSTITPETACIREEEFQGCPVNIPNGNVEETCRLIRFARASSYVTDINTRNKLLIVRRSLVCENGEWVTEAMKYDSTITPETACIREEEFEGCPANIPNGNVEETCTRFCYPDCDDGYTLPYGIFPVARRLFCVRGTWLTKTSAYNGNNICFPDGGHPCSQEIPNGLAGRWERTYPDFGHGRLRSGAYVCNDGFRRNRARIMIECIAGQWQTGLERFGIDISKVCLPMSSNEWYSEDQD